MTRKSLVRRAIGKPPRVVAFRTLQEVRLAALRLVGGWNRIDRKISQWWTPQRIRSYLESGRRLVLADDGPSTLRSIVDIDPAYGERIVRRSRRILERDMTILGHAVPVAGDMPWARDWVWDHTWEPRYFRDYDHYEGRSRPYDVKLPWELSRLAFLIPLLQGAALEESNRYLNATMDLLDSWCQSNPLANSVNWYPMEASMRGIYLSTALEMLVSCRMDRLDIAGTLLQQLSRHGEFVARTVEYSELRGNHYIANLTCLLTIGALLDEWYPRAPLWLRYAAKRLPSEVARQFLNDGVNVEKSLGYHKLVLELFLLAHLVFERRRVGIGDSWTQRIHAACLYSAWCMRPDGRAPNVGDTDDSSVFHFDDALLRDHRTALAIGAALFNDERLKTHDELPPSLCWLLGGDGVRAYEKLRCVQITGMQWFKQGGVVVVRSAGGQFGWMDIGEVGMSGRGGHGHNDLGSFEWAVGGVPVLVDPGCPVYTGDASMRDRFRSTGSHNTVVVDGAEQALMRGMWEISDDARPQRSSVYQTNRSYVVSVTHAGYRRLTDPVTLTRTVDFALDLKAVVVLDTIDAMNCHEVVRYWHFSPLWSVVPCGEGICAMCGDLTVHMAVDEWSTVSIEPGLVSEGYGDVRGAATVVVRTVCNGSGTLATNFVVEHV